MTYSDLERLVGLLDKSRYHLYTVSGKSTEESVIASISNNGSNVGEIARHHRSIQSLRNTDTTAIPHKIKYFTSGRA